MIKIMVAALILVRMDSERLPQKAFLPLGGIKLIEYPIQALLKSKLFKPIITTTDRAIDEPLVELARYYNIDIFRGSLENVSRRVINCLKFFNIEEFVRINGDSPFVRLDLLQQGYTLLKENKYDFVTNLYPRTFPYGISLELFKAKFYIKNMNEIIDPFYTENITSYFYKNIDRFKYGSITMGAGKNYQDIHLTVDVREDLDFLQKMIDFDGSVLGKDKSIEEIVSVYKAVNNNFNKSIKVYNI